jgi:hypothetical protein
MEEFDDFGFENQSLNEILENPSPNLSLNLGHMGNPPEPFSFTSNLKKNDDGDFFYQMRNTTSLPLNSEL